MKEYHRLSLDNLVSPNDLYRKIDGAIDFHFIYDLAKECYSHTGQPSLDPVVFFKIELVGFLEGIHEDRALERRIKDSLAIRWFLGYDLDEALPVHSTISRTRKDRMTKTVYQAVFDHILELCIRRQLVNGSHQSIDSTLLKANASLRSLEALQSKVIEHYQKTMGHPDLKDDDKNVPTPPAQVVSKPLRRDQEAKVTKKPGFQASPYYKASTSVDEAYGIITHAQIDDANKNDLSLFKPLVTKVKQCLSASGLSLKSLAADQGFYSAENLHFLDQEQLTAYIPPKLQRGRGKIFHQDLFRYIPQNDQFICPEGNILKARQLDTQLPHLKRYQARQKDCRLCPQKKLCTRSQARTLRISVYEPLIQAARQRCESPKGREIAKQRHTQAEGTFANLKEVLKFRKLYCLGLKNATKKFLMACTVINLKKMFQALDIAIDMLHDVLTQLLGLFKEQEKFKLRCSVA